MKSHVCGCRTPQIYDTNMPNLRVFVLIQFNDTDIC